LTEGNGRDTVGYDDCDDPYLETMSPASTGRVISRRDVDVKNRPGVEKEDGEARVKDSKGASTA
jgi:hypothetical protein